MIPDPSIGDMRRFYETLFGMTVGMDHGWTLTLMSDHSAETQTSIAQEGGSGTPVPDLSIEVSNVDEVFERASAHGFPIACGLTDEPWGMRRLHLHDSAGKLVNILAHRRP